MTRAAICVLVLVLAACRNASDSTIDAGIAGPDADVAPVTTGVAIAVFGAPGPDDGVQDPVFFVGCPTAGSAAVELFYVATAGDAIDEGPHVASFTRTGVHDHVAVGTSLVLDLDEQGANPTSAPFVYPATVTTDPSFYNIVNHTFAAHILDPAVPAMNNLGAWNTDVLVSCPAG